MARRAFSPVLVAITILCCWSGARAQPGRVEMLAATATNDANAPEVRLMWRIGQGWLTSEGVRVYRCDPGALKLDADDTRGMEPKAAEALRQGNYSSTMTVPAGARDALKKLPKTRLIHSVEKLTELDFDRVLPKEMRDLKVLSTPGAARPERALDFAIKRPPSAAGTFRELKAATAEARTLKKALPTTDTRRKVAENQNKLATLAGGKKPVARDPDDDKPPAVKPEDALASARSTLLLYAALHPDRAPGLGLGARDAQVAKGQKHLYALYAVVRGEEQDMPLATVAITVGEDQAPPAPANVDALQHNNRVALRWDRIDPDLENRLVAISYVVERAFPNARRAGGGAVARPEPPLAWEPATKHPIVILDTDEESKSFFRDTLTDARDVAYRVALVDGFGRRSAWTTIREDIEDWRHPGAPSQARARLDVDPPAAAPSARAGTVRLKDWSAKVVAGANPGAAVQLSWRPPEDVPQDLHLVYRVYRLDADDPQAASSEDPISKATLLTPAPVEGEQSFIVKAAKADAAAELELGLPPYLSAQPKHQAQIKQEKMEVRRWTDTRCALDHIYRYFVVAEYKESGLTSSPVDAGAVGIPDPRAPKAVTSIRKNGFAPIELRDEGEESVEKFQAPKFGMSGALDLKAVDFGKVQLGKWQYTPLKPAGAVRAGSGPAPRPGGDVQRGGTGAPIGGPIPGAGGGTGFAGRTPTKLPTAATDDLMGTRFVRSLRLAELHKSPANSGGTVTLEWTPSENLKGLKYHIRRRLKTDDGSTRWDELGTVGPAVATKADIVPRSRACTYEYEITPVSRWGVSGRRTVLAVDVPSTVPPAAPNILAASPDPEKDARINVRIAASPPEESVKEFVIYRSGTPSPIATVAADAKKDEIVWSDDGVDPRKPAYEYSAVARTEIGKDSPRSRKVSAAAVKSTAAAPPSARWRMTPEGAAIEWDAAPDASAYIVRRRVEGKDASGKAVTGPTVVVVNRIAASGAKGTFRDTTAFAGRPYIYEVLAVDGAANVSAATLCTAN